MPVQFRQKAFQGTSYIVYWLRAMNEHSLHPPFVYQLYKEAIKKECFSPDFERIEKQRTLLLKSKELIEVADQGAGSSITGAKKRSIGRIACHSLTSPRFSRLLYRLIQHMGAKTVLELGTSLGINTLYLSAAVPNGTVYTLEGCPGTAAVAHKAFSEWPYRNISLVEGNIDVVLPALLTRQLNTVDAAYIDANHTYEASLHYFNLLLPHLHKGSFIVMDDIYWSPGMKKAWNEICQHPEVSLSIDLYHAGLLFFKPGSKKAHYVLEL